RLDDAEGRVRLDARPASATGPSLPTSFVVRDVTAKDDVSMTDPHALLVPGHVHDARAAAILHPTPLLPRHERVVTKDILIDVVFVAPGLLDDGVDVGRDPPVGIRYRPD